MADADILAAIQSVRTGAAPELPAPAAAAPVEGDSAPAQEPAFVGSKGSIRVRFPNVRTALTLDEAAKAVDLQESGGSHFDDKGGIKTSSKGARGRMQLLPSSFPGVDIDNEGVNLAEGKKYLGTLFDKYGQWEDAFAAYNAGPGRVDKWLKAGRPERGKDALPEETKKYVPAVLAKLGLSDESPSAVVEAKRRTSMDDILDMTAKDAPGAPASEDGEKTRRDLADLSSMKGIGIPSIDERLDALAHTFTWGALKVPLGAAQMLGERVAPEKTQEITDRINELESQGEGAQRAKDHPIIGAVGGALGTVFGIGGATKAIGAIPQPQALTRIAASVADRLGWVGRGAVAGGAAGAASYNPTHEDGQRLVEGVGGMLFGGLIGAAAGAVYNGARSIATREGYRNFINLVQRNVKDVATSAENIKQKFVNQFDLVQREKTQKYSLRNTAGEELSPGFDRKTMGNPIAEAAESSRLNGVSIAPGTNAIARQVDRALGGPEARELEAAHEASVAKWEKDVAAWKKEADKVVSPNLGAAAQEQARAAAIQHGILPSAPVHPGEFEPPPVTPEQFSMARQALQTGRARSKDSMVRRQLNDMRRSLLDSAKTAADEAGLDVSTYLNRAAEADRFNRETYVPMRQAFGDNPRAVDPSKFYDRIVSLVEGAKTNPDAINRMIRNLGPEGKQAFIDVMAHRAFTSMTNAARVGLRRGGPQGELVASASRVSDYIHEHERALLAVVGKDGTEQLMGMAHIAEGIARQPEKNRALYHMLASHGWLQAIGAARLGEGVFEGSMEKMKTGAGLIVLPWVGHILYSVLSQASKLPGLLPVVRRAAATAPDTKAMDRIMTEFDRRLRRTALVSGGAVGQTVGQAVGPALAPAGAAAQGLAGLQ